MTLKSIIFGANANNKVTLVTAPSYTSVNQKWKGAAPILKKIVNIMKKTPKNRKISSDVYIKLEINSNDNEPKDT